MWELSILTALVKRASFSNQRSERVSYLCVFSEESVFVTTLDEENNIGIFLLDLNYLFLQRCVIFQFTRRILLLVACWWRCIPGELQQELRTARGRCRRLNAWRTFTSDALCVASSNSVNLRLAFITEVWNFAAGVGDESGSKLAQSFVGCSWQLWTFVVIQLAPFLLRLDFTVFAFRRRCRFVVLKDTSRHTDSWKP